jgi:hypothetical protein
LIDFAKSLQLFSLQKDPCLQEALHSDWPAIPNKKKLLLLVGNYNSQQFYWSKIWKQVSGYNNSVSS